MSSEPRTGNRAEQREAEHALQCMEIIGGNRAIRQTIDAPGLKIWIDSRPLGRGGGDVHYVSTCGAGYVTRLALADISGHGESVDRLAVALRKLMRKHINTLDQTRFARSLNRELAALDQSGRFATAVLATYFAPSRHLILCNAGHGRPLWYSTQHAQWQYLDLESAGDCQTLKLSKARYHLERLANLPLGILDPINYQQFAVELGHGDMVVLCTDAITECSDDAGEMLGETGLLALVRQLGSNDRSQIGERLVDAIEARRNGRTAADDQTLIVLEHSSTGPPRPSLGRTVRTLAKMIGLSRV
ncbi:MAG TPA: PP2C family protein-serine/threonine phosphatase [Planctomycetaceae bacterium]|jgi:serine phosphatase RsbU (regulator of sigma subunit)|nr:PP2C family protein-serine/threonine phosphatase [Planctomycetaceae bacterium]